MVLDWVPHPEFLVFLTEGGERTFCGVEEAAMMRFPCSAREGAGCLVPTKSAQGKTFRT